MSHYDLQWPTMNHYDPQWPKLFTLWRTMAPNLVNCFTMTQNKVLGLFIYLIFVLKIPFWGNLTLKLQSVLFKMKLGTKGYLRVLILKVAIVFSNFVPKICFLSKFGPKPALFKIKHDTKGSLRGLISNLIILIFNSIPKIPFLGVNLFLKIPSPLS